MKARFNPHDVARYPSVRLARLKARLRNADHVRILNVEHLRNGALLDEMAALAERRETAYDLPLEGGWW